MPVPVLVHPSSHVRLRYSSREMAIPIVRSCTQTEVISAKAAVDTLDALEVFNTPGRLASCYKITRDGARALQWVMQEADWNDEEETGWN